MEMRSVFGKVMLLSIIVAGLLKIVQQLFSLDMPFLYYLQILVLSISLIAALMLMFITYIKNKTKNNQDKICDKLS